MDAVWYQMLTGDHHWSAEKFRAEQGGLIHLQQIIPTPKSLTAPY